MLALKHNITAFLNMGEMLTFRDTHHRPLPPNNQPTFNTDKTRPNQP